MAELVGIRPDQFVVDKSEWIYRQKITDAECIWSDYKDQVHGNGNVEVSSAEYETRRWIIIKSWVIRFSADARPKDVAQAKIWLEEGPINKLGNIDYKKTEAVKKEINKAASEKRRKAFAQFERKVKSHKLWEYVVAAGVTEGLYFSASFGFACNPEKFLAAFHKGEELQKRNPFRNGQGKLFLEQRFRWSGNTGRQHTWVITPQGEKRAPDFREFDNNGRSRSDGIERWNYVLPDELVLVWEKEYTASPHIFKVMHRPANITPEQKQKILEFEQFAENEFKNTVGISGKRSPGIEDGFKL